MFDSLFTSSTSSAIELMPLLAAIASSLVLGFVIALTYCFRSRHTKGFVLALAVLPAVVCVVIAMVNGNVGAGVAVAGAFSLVRFRSAPGSARDIVFIFLAMCIGLVAGMGYVVCAAVVCVWSCASSCAPTSRSRSAPSGRRQLAPFASPCPRTSTSPGSSTTSSTPTAPTTSSCR